MTDNKDREPHRTDEKPPRPADHYGYDRIRQMSGGATVPPPGPDAEELRRLRERQRDGDDRPAEDDTEQRQGDDA